VRIGSPLVLAQQTARLFSYETSPVIYGGTTWTDADYYEDPTGFSGRAGGLFFFGALVRIDAQTSLTKNTRIFMGRQDTGANGFHLRTLSQNSNLSWVAADSTGTNYLNSPISVVSAADVGKVMPVLCVHDGTKMRFYTKRTEQGTGTAISGFTPATVGPLRIGRLANAATYFGQGITVLGMIAGYAVPTLAEYQAWYDAVLAKDIIVDIPGKTSFRVDLTPTAGALPATLLDRVGSANMTRVGAPALVSQYSRAWAA
jgi:hypothetical protein